MGRKEVPSEFVEKAGEIHNRKVRKEDTMERGAIGENNGGTLRSKQNKKQRKRSEVVVLVSKVQVLVCKVRQVKYDLRGVRYE